MTADDWIDPTKDRRPAKRLSGDPRPKAGRRTHPPRPGRARGWGDDMEKKYQTLAAKYSQLAEQARAADWDDTNLGSSPSDPIPGETHYRIMADAFRMVVADVKREHENPD